MGEQSGGKFRAKKVNFSMISNSIIRDEKISLRAKGLYALIQSYITIEGFTLYKGFLQSRCIEGERAFDSAWAELKEAGYLKQYKMRDGAKGFYYEYDLLDAPIQDEPVECTPTECTPTKRTPTKCTPTKCTPTKRGCINNTIQNNTIQSNILSNHIVSISDTMDQIGYEAFSDLEKQSAKEIALLITEVLNMPDDGTMHIAKSDLPNSLVKERFRELNKFHIEYVLNCIDSNSQNIGNIKNYLLTALYNAPATIDTYYRNKVAMLN